MEVPQKAKNRVAMWSSNPTPGIYLDETIIWKNTCTPMFIAALFTTAKTWKQPKRPLRDEWIKKMWYINTMEYYSAIKNEIMPFAAIWMDLDIIILWGKSERERQTPYGIIYMWDLKLTRTYLQNRNRLTDIENKLTVTKGERGWARDKLGVWD